MLKKASNCVLSSKESSTYPRGYACGSSSPAALLESLFEHPVANAIMITPKSRLFDAIPLTSQ